MGRSNELIVFVSNIQFMNKLAKCIGSAFHKMAC